MPFEKIVRRHVLIALVLLPLLMLSGWWAGEQFLGQQASPAQRGGVYPLAEKSNCRYSSGRCVLENVDFSILLTYALRADGHFLLARASHPLQDILLTVGEGDALKPRPMISQDATSRNWYLSLVAAPDPAARIRLVARSADVIWYGDVATQFIKASVPGAQ